MKNWFTQFQAPLMKFGEKLSRNKILQILRDAFMLAFPLTIFGSITLIIANFPFLAQTIGESAGEKLSRNKILQILRDAFMLAFPLTIFGSITLIIANFPFLAQTIGESAAASLNAMLGPASTATMSFATVFTVLGIGYYFSCDRKVDPIFGAAIAPAAFGLVTPMETVFELETGGSVVVGNVLDINRLGAKGMFVGMIGAFLASWLYSWTTKKNWTIKMPDTVPPAVSKSFSALIPACFTLSVFLLIRIVFQFTPWGNIHDFFYEIVQGVQG